MVPLTDDVVPSRIELPIAFTDTLAWLSTASIL
jgi:hypothetical protein